MSRIKKSIFVTLVVALFTGLSYLTVKSYLNTAGYCLSKMRVITDQELINLGIEDIIKNTAEVEIHTTTETGVADIKRYKVVPYSSAVEFLRDNKECCKIVRREFFGTEDRPVDISSFKAKGKYRGDFYGDYTLKYVDEKNLIQLKKYSGRGKSFDNCGNINSPD